MGLFHRIHVVSIIWGINNSPDVTNKFNTHTQDPIQGCDVTHNALGENEVKRWKQFKTYFGCQDAYKPVAKSKEALNRKVQPMLEHIHEV